MKTTTLNLHRAWCALAGLIVLAGGAQHALADGANNFTQTNLVSDIPGLATITDPDLKNPWGVSFSSASPFWVSDNGTGLAALLLIGCGVLALLAFKRGVMTVG